MNFSRLFHRWHRAHLGIALAVLIIGGLLTLVNPRLLGQHIMGVSQELEHLIGTFSIWFFGLYVGLWIFVAGLARLWPPPVVAQVALPIITKLPDALEMPNDGSHWKFGTYFGPKFRYRFACQEDLNCFVELSIAHPALLLANRDLDERGRSELYERWYSSTPKGFMVLETQAVNQSDWSPIAVSIVLPLSKSGTHELWTGSRRTIQIEEKHLANRNARPTALLVDTLAVRSAQKTRFCDLVFAFPQVHAAQFWTPRGRKKMEYWIEPDHRALPKLLHKLGFEGPHEIAKGHNLFRLVVPLVKRNLSQRQLETLVRIVENMKKCGEWQIH